MVGLVLHILTVMGSTVSVCCMAGSLSDLLVDLAAPSLIKFGIESKFASILTSTDGFKAGITNALEDMRTTCNVAPAHL